MTISALRCGYLFVNLTSLLNNQRRRRRGFVNLENKSQQQEQEYANSSASALAREELITTTIIELPQNYNNFSSAVVSNLSSTQSGGKQIYMYMEESNSSYPVLVDAVINTKIIFNTIDNKTTSAVSGEIQPTTTNTKTLVFPTTTTVKTTSKAATATKKYKISTTSVTGPIIYIEVPLQAQFVANITISYGFDQADLVGYNNNNNCNNNNNNNNNNANL